ncbi:MAG: lipid IV(A) 3-deoxy-D-manno-octulosonic acid transferase [Gammaproteobacteria bacterium]|nr:lipid IV(A) 3-deoxy-D-manno-octulosonic acid transferase [Gammaproteobacteria bacterium]
MLRHLYSFLFYLAGPFLVLRLLFRSLKQPAYRERMAERFGFYGQRLDKSIWVHAVSVGEVLAAIPLIKLLKSRYPHLPIVVTTMTPTGAERVKKALGKEVIHLYIPYDMPTAVRRFLQAIKPVVGVIMETELWPNLLAVCRAKKVPMCLVNARLSEKSARGYQRIKGLSKAMLQTLHIIAAHGHADATRLKDLGASEDKVVVTGNLKFDIEIPEVLIEKGKNLRAELGQDRFVWLAASTHEGEEEIILAAHQRLCAHDPQALLILVPRHPERFNTIAKMAQASFQVARRSQQTVCLPQTNVYLGDTMGELLMMYAACDVAFVGGSLIARGGHNILEPAALSKPILSGPSLFNFAEISEMFIREDAIQLVDDASHLAEKLEQLRQHTTEALTRGQRARAIIDANRGALLKQFDLITATISSR